MAVIKLLKITAVCCAAVLFVSCGNNATSKVSKKISSDSVKTSSFQKSQEIQPDYSAGVKQQAEYYHSTPARVALSMIITKLDNSYAYTDLVKKSGKELFDVLSETATENNITLESLANKYWLCDILASEKIYVSIEANNVKTLPAPKANSSSQSSSSNAGKGSSSNSSSSSAVSSSADSDPSWAAKFDKAIQKSLK